MTVDRCPSCGRRDHEDFHRRLGVPALCNALCASADDARRVARGDVVLAICRHCSMVWNREFDPTVLDYDSQYENSLHFSSGFRDFAADLAASLRRHVRHGGTVVELGCGQGDFLELVCARPDLRGVGVDPAFRGPTEHAGRIRYAAGSWDAIADDVEADLVCARHVLEHLPDPGDLFEAADALLGPSPGALLYVEVPDARYMLEHVALWDVVYEHPLYFADVALVDLAVRSGFDVTATGSSFGGQYLWIEARRAGSGVSDRHHLHGDGLRGLAASFDARASAIIDQYSTDLARAYEAGRRVALWGTGSKGTCFLDTVARGGEIAAVVDANPRKHGLHLPGTGHRVLAPAELRGAAVDDVIVLNPNYHREVSAELDRLGVSARLLATADAGGSRA